MDTYLQPHTDASSATLNLNLNLPGEEFTGSEVDFFERSSGRVKRPCFEPGMAMSHRGNVAHAAQPITSGERTNMVLWLYGERMQTRGKIPSMRQYHESSVGPCLTLKQTSMRFSNTIG